MHETAAVGNMLLVYVCLPVFVLVFVAAESQAPGMLRRAPNEQRCTLDLRGAIEVTMRVSHED